MLTGRVKILVVSLSHRLYSNCLFGIPMLFALLILSPRGEKLCCWHFALPPNNWNCGIVLWLFHRKSLSSVRAPKPDDATELLGIKWIKLHNRTLLNLLYCYALLWLQNCRGNARVHSAWFLVINASFCFVDLWHVFNTFF